MQICFYNSRTRLTWRQEMSYVQQMDSIAFADEMQQVRRAEAERKVKSEHFNDFPV